jgi:hypothetical protein
MRSIRLVAASTAVSLLAATAVWVVADGRSGAETPRPALPSLAADITLEDWDDGFNHFLVTVTPEAVAAGGRLRVGVEHAGSPLTAEELRDLDPALADALTGTSGSTVDPEAVVAHLAGLEGVVSVEHLDGAMAAITTEPTVSLADVAAFEGVADPVEDVLMSTFAWEPSEPLFPAAWHLESEGQSHAGTLFGRDTDIDAPEAWDAARGEGVVIAVIDAGFTAGTPELASNLWVNRGETCGDGIDDDGNGLADDCHGWDFNANAPLRPFDGTQAHFEAASHGISVASAAAAPAGNEGVVGVAPAARLMLLGAGSNRSISIAAAFRAIDYAIANGADVVNMSFGGGIPDEDAYRAYWEPALARLEAANIVVVAAAGNSASPEPTSPALFVGERANGLAVAASDPADARSSFSQFGDWVSLAAPGSAILTSYPDGVVRRADGTSYSSPVTAGAAAVLRSAFPGATAADVVRSLGEGADRLPSLASFVPAGRRLNVERALAHLSGAEPASFLFTDLTNLPPSARVTVSAPAGDAVTFTLATMVDDQVVSVPGHDVAWNGQLASTDDTGRVTFAADPATGVASPISIGGLPPGAYGLIGQVQAGGVALDVPVLSVFTLDSPTGPATTTPTTPVAPGQVPTGGTPDASPPSSGGGSTPPPGGANSPGQVPGDPSATATPSATAPTSPPQTAPTVPSAPAPSGDGSELAPDTGGEAAPNTGSGPAVDGSTTNPEEPPTIPSDGDEAEPDSRGSPDGSSPTTAPQTDGSRPASDSIASPSGIRVIAVSPEELSTTGGTLVIEADNLPEHPVVTAGGSPARVLDRIWGYLLVEVAPGGPGWADVTIRPLPDPADVATLTNAFVYVGSPAGGGAGSSGGGSSPQGQGPGAGGAPAGGDTSGDIPGDGDIPGGGDTPDPSGGAPEQPIDSTTTTVARTTTTNAYGIAYPSHDWNLSPSGLVTGPVVPGNIGLDQWNAAYQAAGSSPGVRLSSWSSLSSGGDPVGGIAPSSTVVAPSTTVTSRPPTTDGRGRGRGCSTPPDRGRGHELETAERGGRSGNRPPCPSKNPDAPRGR